MSRDNNKIQDRILREAIAKNKIYHTYLFEGERGLGKRDLASAFSKALLCKSGGIYACNSCNSCLKFDKGEHPDFTIIEPKDGKILIGPLNKMVKETATAPFESRKKIVLIDGLEKVSVRAQNTLLNILEEPPEYQVNIILSANAELILPTIISRAWVIRFSPENSEILSRGLCDEFQISRDEADYIADLSGNAYGRAVELLKIPKLFEKRDSFLNNIDKVLKGDLGAEMEVLKFMDEEKDDYEIYLDIMLFWFRDLLLYKEGGAELEFINRSKISILESEKNIDNLTINDIIKGIEKTKSHILSGVNYNFSMEMLFVCLKGE